MVRVGSQIPITERFKNFIFWFWGIIYLFFASIFGMPKKNNGKIHGVKRGVSGPMMGGG